MKILQISTYYYPYISGMTVYMERLSRALAGQGHQVTILTSRYNPGHPPREASGNVAIIRSPVFFRLSKGFIMPSLAPTAYRLMKDADVVHLHLPQFDAGYLSLMARLLGKTVISTYHCDINMQRGALNQLAQQAVKLMDRIAVSLSNQVVTYTEDYAGTIPLLKKNRYKLVIIPPPVQVKEASSLEVADFRKQFNAGNRFPVIGMATRFASEKGIHTLLEALPALIRQYPRAMVLFAGEYQNVPGEGDYINKLAPLIKGFQASGHWVYTGLLEPEQMPAYYPNIDLLLVTSTNSTESFGLVQVEAMLCGKPVVASDLPGVRTPVGETGYGALFTPGDASSLVQAVLPLLGKSPEVKCQDLASRYHPDAAASRYLSCYKAELLQDNNTFQSSRDTRQ